MPDQSLNTPGSSTESGNLSLPNVPAAGGATVLRHAPYHLFPRTVTFGRAGTATVLVEGHQPGDAPADLSCVGAR
jgi:hypothetical protein